MKELMFIGEEKAITHFLHALKHYQHHQHPNKYCIDDEEILINKRIFPSKDDLKKAHIAIFFPSPIPRKNERYIEQLTCLTTNHIHLYVKENELDPLLFLKSILASIKEEAAAEQIIQPSKTEKNKPISFFFNKLISQSAGIFTCKKIKPESEKINENLHAKKHNKNSYHV